MKNVFPERLKQLRTEKGLTQERIAEILNVKRSTYGEYERGKISPPIEKIELLSEILNTTPQYLLGWENQTVDTYKHDTAVGSMIKRLRGTRKISSEEFAKELGISVLNLTEYEDGTTHIPADMAKIIAYYFSVPIDKLLSVNTIGDALDIVYDLEQKDRTVKLKKWTKEFKNVIFTEKEIDKIIDYAKYLLYQRKE